MRKVLAIGSIGVVVLLFLASFPSIASAQTINSNDVHSSLVRRLFEKQKSSLSSDWYFGELIDALFGLLVALAYWWVKIHNP